MTLRACFCDCPECIDGECCEACRKMSPTTTKPHGQLLYEAGERFWKTAGPETLRNFPLPPLPWEELPDYVQRYWEAVAQAAKEVGAEPA